MDGYEKEWRAFERNEVTHSAAHYLLAVASFAKAGRDPRAVDIARQLEVSRAAVSLQIRTLRENGLVDVGDDHRIHLTRDGADLVARIASKREIMRLFLIEVLGVDPDTAERDACKIEHLISEESGAALVRFITSLRADETALADLVRKTRGAISAAPVDSVSELDKVTDLLRDDRGDEPEAP